MYVTIDSMPLPVEAMGLTTVGQVLSHVQQQNRLVTQVLIDGLVPDLQQVPQLRKRILTGHTVFIETAEPRAVVLEVIDEVERQLATADVSRNEALDRLRAGEPNKALQKLSSCFGVWQHAQESIQKIAQLLRLDLSRITVSGTTLAGALNAFAQQLRDVRSSLENRDYVLLGDVLAYEMDTTIALWRDAFIELRAIVK